MNATQELIKAAQSLLERATESMDSETMVKTVYGYKLERCPDELLERYVELANENIRKAKCAKVFDLGRKTAVDSYICSLGTVERELEARKALSITIKQVTYGQKSKR